MVEQFITRARYETRKLSRPDPRWEAAVKSATLRQETRDGAPGFVIDKFHPALVEIRTVPLAPVKPIPAPGPKPSPERYDQSQWPRSARWLAKLAKPDDLGLGDVLQRYAAKIGGERYKVLYKKIMGEDCGCAARQLKMNLKFPLREWPAQVSASCHLRSN